MDEGEEVAKKQVSQKLLMGHVSNLYEWADYRLCLFFISPFSMWWNFNVVWWNSPTCVGTMVDRSRHFPAKRCGFVPSKEDFGKEISNQIASFSDYY